MEQRPRQHLRQEVEQVHFLLLVEEDFSPVVGDLKEVQVVALDLEEDLEAVDLVAADQVGVVQSVVLRAALEVEVKVEVKNKASQEDQRH